MDRAFIGRFVARFAHDENGCAVWTGPLRPSGYGYMNRPGEKVATGIHRLSYELFVGPIPDGLHIDHLCRNRACGNPDHLEPVTPRENLMRGETRAAANAAKTHCPRGHEYTAENTRMTKTGTRACRACERERARQWRLNNPEVVKFRNAIQNAKRRKPRTIATHCKNGHELTPENIAVGSGYRKCRTCYNEYRRLWRKA